MILFCSDSFSTDKFHSTNFAKFRKSGVSNLDQDTISILLIIDLIDQLFENGTLVEFLYFLYFCILYSKDWDISERWGTLPGADLLKQENLSNLPEPCIFAD